MIVVGGSYHELCTFPEWDRIYGSGGRAAVALSQLSPGLSFYTYAYRGWANDVRATMAGLKVRAEVVEIDDELVFEYYHPLSKDVVPWPSRRERDLAVTGDMVLSFGMLEGKAMVNANRVVFDPQSHRSKEEFSFSATGSRATNLAYVIRDYDLVPPDSTDDPRDAATRIMSEEGAEVVVARHATGGATVYIGDAMPTRIAAYPSSTWFKIGSGDVFCASFAHYWGDQRFDAVDAADLASRSVAYFNDGHRLPLPATEVLSGLTPLREEARPGKICLAGPYVTMPQRWLLQEAYVRLRDLGSDVFSPVYEFGIDDTALLAREGIRGLKACTAVLALVDSGDPGSNFYVGYARANGLPVVIFGQGMTSEGFAMFSGTRCEVTSDFATALYRSHLASHR